MTNAWIRIGQGLTVLAAGMTAIVPSWIETVFKIDPDGGNGAVEWLLVAALAGVAVACELTLRARSRMGQTDDRG
jgi:tetrahydromethanopterin S-methyltransferase subunit E